MILKFAVFIFVTATLAYISRHSLRNYCSHGFYRFFAWEAILILALLNIHAWFTDPLNPLQIISWLCLLISLYFVSEGFYLLRFIGKADNTRPGSELLKPEKTTTLINSGIYKYIRHPMYSSLMFLALGIFLKLPSLPGLLLTMLAILFLIITAKVEEQENVRYFGTRYETYMKKTKCFIPFVC